VLCARCARKVCRNRICYKRPNGILLEAIPLFVPTNPSRRSGLGQSSLLGPTHYPSSSLITWPESSRAMAHNVWRKNAAPLRTIIECWRTLETIHFLRPEARNHFVSKGVERLSHHIGERRFCACYVPS
jgi:hypothetical protein